MRNVRCSRMFLTSILNNKSLRPKLILGSVLVLFFLIVYLFPSFYQKAKKQLQPSAFDCVDEILSDYTDRINSLDVRVIQYSEYDEFPSHELLGFLGNGRYGITLKHGKVVISDTSLVQPKLTIQTEFKPLLKPLVQHSSFHGAYIVDYYSGQIVHLQAFLQERKCVSVEQSFLLHRTKSNLLIQHFVVRNQLGHQISVDIKSQDVSATSRQNAVLAQVAGDDYFVREEKTSSGVNAIMMQQVPPEHLEVEARGKTSLTLLTGLDHSHSVSPTLLKERLMNELTQSVPEIVSLMSVHIDTWHKIWATGIHVGDSADSSAAAAISINETIYNVLSATEDKLLQNQHLSEEERRNLQQLIKHPDHTCFTGPPNIDAAALWQVAGTWDQLASLVDIWYLTLEKHGCSKLLTAGLSGVYEALVLSVFSLQFSEDHLALKSQPEYFHRNMSVRQVTYKDCAVNLGVVLLLDGHAEMKLASNMCAPGFHLYACDAGCSSPILLSSAETSMTVRETTPDTPILYISESESHLVDLKKVIHFKTIRNYFSKEQIPKRSHDALLPTAFWVVVAFVIVAFHVFLVVLLYREYWRGGGSGVASSYDNYDSKSFIPSYNISKYSYASKSNSFKK
jgi:hypothetical protein